MRVFVFALYIWAGVLANDMRAQWNVLFGHEEFRRAETMLQDYLGKLRASSEAQREKLIGGLRDRADLEKFQAQTAARLQAILGEFPARTPLNAQMVGRLDRSGYAIEKVIFESRPHYYVTANVYVPLRGSGPFPTVLCPVGHWGAGKFFEDYQRLGAYLARRGFLVLVYDVPGQGERQQYFDPVLGRTLLSPGNTQWFVTIEHGYAGGQTILTRDNYAAYLVWDGIRALDYLVQRSDVDRDKIACTGTSGGGLQAELLSAVDPRIKVSIPVCYGGCAPDTPARRGLTMTDVDALIAPKPLLMIEATGDPRSGVLAKRKRHELVSKLYEVLQASDRTQFAIFEEPHGYGEAIRRGAYRWLSRWLRGTDPSADSLAEEPILLEPESALACTTTGQVKTALGGETVFTLNRAEAARIRDRQPLPQTREAWRDWQRRLRSDVESRLAFVNTDASLRARTMDRLDKGSYLLEKVVYHSDPDIYVPGLLFLPKQTGPRPAVVFVNEGGKTAAGAVEDYLRPLAESGIAMFAIDSRGTGETAATAASREGSYRGFTSEEESRLSYESLSAGTTLLGMRTRDVLRAVDYLKTRSEINPAMISVAGHGAGGLLAMHAAALDDRIRSAAVTGTLISYASIVENEIYAHRYSMFVPGALSKYDLPELAALIAPRAVMVINAVDQAQRPLELQRASEVYAPATKVFGLMGAAGGIRVERASSAAEIVKKYRKLFLEPQ
jgi:cephalosporin-C deacetylase-like acetyl esterase